MGQFARLRNRETDAAGFCLGLLGQVRDAQERALDAVFGVKQYLRQHRIMIAGRQKI